jgi:hypothetical protein
VSSSSASFASHRLNEIEPLLQSGVRSYIYDTITSPRGKLGSAERLLRDRFMYQESNLRALLETADQAGGGEVDRLERDQIRPLILQIRQFALREHLTLARPSLGWESVPVIANQVCLAGAPAFCEMFSLLLQQRNLSLAVTSRSWEQVLGYWSQLRESGFCIFGFPERFPVLRASVSYRLGWALACGKAILVVKQTRKKLPFDVDVEPAAWDPKDPGNALGLSAALDEAIFCVPRGSGLSSVRETLQFAKSQLNLQNDEMDTVQRWLDSPGALDPIEVCDFLKSLPDLQAGGFALIFPPWPGFYPDAQDRRCFHVMPYDKSFDGAREAVRSACSTVGIRYIRDDETKGKRLITHSIWQEIGKASLVVVDVTGLNPNVALELGLADVLGRSVLLVARDEVNSLFPEISKRPVKIYSSPSALRRIVESELSAG